MHTIVAVKKQDNIVDCLQNMHGFSGKIIINFKKNTIISNLRVLIPSNNLQAYQECWGSISSYHSLQTTVPDQQPPPSYTSPLSTQVVYANPFCEG